ncbi:MAG: glycoside hydrolase domain-containing protein [Bacteroidota bacterium]
MKKILFATVLSCLYCLLQAQNIPYTSGNNSWKEDSLGNHRAVVQFTGEGKTARVIIPWRRNDIDPAKKRIIVQDAKTGAKILNTRTGIIDNEKGELWFEPVSGKGLYYVYYMPYKNEGRSNYPKGVYLPVENTANSDWFNGTNSTMPPNALVKEFQSISEFNSFYPMEVIATAEESAAVVNKSGRTDYLVFAEDRMYPVKMKNRLPYRWMQKGISNSFSGKADKGENYTYQLALYALKNMEDISVSFTDLTAAGGKTISSKDIYCINTGGTDYAGKPFTKKISVAQKEVQSLWCGVDVPKNIPAGVYKGKATISAANALPTTIDISITVSDKVLADGGISDPQKQTRLHWINSTLAQENTVIAPYTPLTLQQKTISLLGRNVELNDEGFPKQIQTYFTQEMTGYSDQPNTLLYEPIHFHFTKMDGKNLTLKSKGLVFTKQEAGTIQWQATTMASDTLQMDVTGSLEFDGFASFTVKVTALQDIQLKDMPMHIPFKKEMAKYLMGLNQKGGERQDPVNWKWDVATKNQDGAWIGSVNAGLQYSLRDENYVRPLNTNFYLQKPLVLPSSWANGTKGGIDVGIKGSSMLANNYSGERKIKKGDVLYFNFTLLITPFHTINTDFQWETRFYHKYNDLDTIKATGATVVNIHHATPINPWINYPFIEYKKMKSYIDQAHSKGLKVKIYNTVRELSNRAYETFPLRSLGHEIYSPGNGGGFSWLQEHVNNDYIAAWFVPAIKDAALVNSGMSRWHNYYVEGMNWLTKNVGIDGIYLDDVAFDRITMKRVKRVLTQDGHPGIIDLHSANQYNKSDGFNNSANLYMEHFPYLSRLWFGEYFDYEKNGPDFFLTEVSGIPFGLMGEMLQDGGNAWRGMIYGMTNRMPWSDNADPRPIWKVWDDFGMKGSSMIGYWSDNCPVKTSNDKVLATVYKKKGAALIAIASWATDDASVQLKIDWNKLGIDPAKATISAPSIKNFQSAASFSANDNIKFEKGKGWLLIVKEK